MATNGDNRVGEIVENYRLTSILGSGSTSVVYLGQRLDDEHALVAVKVLTFHDAAGSSVDRAAFRTRFLREARSARKLRHDHILPVLSYGEIDDLTYMVMPLVTGGTLAARMTSSATPLPLAEIAEYTRQLASALDYAHEQGIVHRDVKPSNILLDEQGKLYLTDFGIARLFDTGSNTLTAGQIGLTHTGQVLGTPYYMAPEQIKGEPVGPATDIYALGVVVYQMVTGQVPYQGDTPLAVALQHLQDEPCPPSLLRSGLPAEAEQAILRAMAKPPAERFARAAELASALDRAVQAEQSSHARPTPNDTRTAAIMLSPRPDARSDAETGDPYASLVGTTLGSYRLEQLIGVSDLGPVFQARSGAEGGLYRLRVLAIAGDQPAESRSIFLGRFQQLAHTVAELQHPYIVPLVDYGSGRGMPYLVSPHIAGPSLTARLGQTGPMELLAAGRALDRIAAALEYAHEHGLLHRSLSTECIFVPSANELAVADFEVRRMVELGVPATAASSLYHNTDACAPEQLSGKPVDTYTDVYALGVVLYQMLTGRPMYSGATKDDIAQQHLYATVPPLRRYRAGLPAALENILARALAKEPEQRFRHPAELSNAYRAIVGSASGSFTFANPAPGASPMASSIARPSTSNSQPALVTPTGQEAREGSAGAGADVASSIPQGRSDTATQASRPQTSGPVAPASGAAEATMWANRPNGSASDGRSSPGVGTGAGQIDAHGEAAAHDAAEGRGPVAPVYVPPAPPGPPPNRTNRRPWGGAAAAVASVPRRLGIPGWIVYIATGIVLFALLGGFFAAAKAGVGPFAGPTADAVFNTPSGDVGYWANESITINASNLGAPPQNTRYAAWMANVTNPNAEPSQWLRLGELSKQPDQSNAWTVTFNAKPYTNLMGQGNRLEIVKEDSTKSAPLTPDPSGVVLEGTYPAGSYQHLQHLLLSWPDAPEHAGFLAAMRHQTFVLQGEASALKEAAFRGDSFAVSCHTQSVLDILEGKPGADYAPLDYKCMQNNITDQIGDGYGYLGDSGQGKFTYQPYIAAVEDHIGLALDALGNSSDSLPELKMHAAHVRDAMENVKTLLTAAQADALKLKQNRGASDTSNTAVDLASKVTAALQYSVPEGAQADPTQFGVVDAFNHTEFAATLHLTPPSGS